MDSDIWVAVLASGGLWAFLQYVAQWVSERRKRQADVSKIETEIEKLGVDSELTLSDHWRQAVKDCQESASQAKIEAERGRQESLSQQKQIQDLLRRFDAMQIIVLDLLTGIEITNREVQRLGGVPVWKPSIPDELIMLAVGDNNVLQSLRLTLRRAGIDGVDKGGGHGGNNENS